MQASYHRKKYCDFVVWTMKDSAEPHIERIYLSMPFVQNALGQVKEFYVVGILPELLGKYYTRAVQEDDYSNGKPTVYCYCEETGDVASLVKCHADTTAGEGFII